MKVPPHNKTLVVVTGNVSKANEISAITGWQAMAVDVKIPEIQSMDIEEVAREKAIAAHRQLNKPVVVDDTGMFIESLGGLPGPLVSWFLDAIGPAGVLRIVGNAENRRARVATCIAYADMSTVKTFVGSVDGELSTELRGENGFGYDPIFIPKGGNKTYAEMTSAEKNAISMRKLALEKFREYLSILDSVDLD